MGQFYLPDLIILLAYQVMSNCSRFILEAGKIFVSAELALWME